MGNVEFNKGDKAFVVSSNPQKGIINIVQVEVTGHLIDNLQQYEKKAERLIPIESKKKIQYGFLYADNPQVTGDIFKTRAGAIQHAQKQVDNLTKQLDVEVKQSADHIDNVKKNYNEMIKSIEELMVVPEKKEETAKPIEPKPTTDDKPAKD